MALAFAFIAEQASYLTPLELAAGAVVAFAYTLSI